MEIDGDVRAAYDVLARKYDEMYQDDASRAEDRVIARLLHRRIAAARTVIDVGCGTGWLLDHFTANLRQYVGFDLSPGMLAQAGFKHPQDRSLLREGDMNGQWPVPLEWADLVVSTFASPSYARPLDFMRRAAAHLKPGGRVLLMPHAPGNDLRPHYLNEDAYAGCRPWTVAEVRHACREAGFARPTIVGFQWAGLKLATTPLLLRLEMATVGRVLPEWCSFLVIEAKKP